MPKNYADLFDIEKRFEHYLEIVQLDKSKMSPIQLIETRRAFWGGMGSAFVALNNDLNGLDEEASLEVLIHLTMQVSQFWIKEVGTDVY